MVKVSLCMIVRNEEAVLGRCLESVGAIADEIIIVDTGSTDGTKEVARKFTDKIYDFKWIDDFSKARNFSFSNATGDFLMWLDADDVILEEDHEKMIELKKILPSHADIVTMRYNVGFDEAGNTTFHSTRGRWFNRKNNPTWHDEVHEYLPLVGNIFQRNDICITHRPNKTESSDRNLKIYKRILKRDGKLSARGNYYYARELKDHGIYADAVKQFENFLKQGEGWKEDNIASCFELGICYNMLGKPDKSLESLLKSFSYDAPRPEICCLVAYHYKNIGDYRTAVSWFETALNVPKKDEMGFVLGDYHGFIPAIESAVCYDKLGRYDVANKYNEIAGGFKPNSNEYLQNKRYFAERLK